MLLSRSPLSGVRPLRYRAQLVLRVRHESSFSSTTLSPFPPHADRRFGSRSCDAQVARAARRSLARSPARAARRSLVLRVRYVKHTLPSTGAFSSLIQALSTISLGHDRFHYIPIVGSILVARMSILRFASPFAHLDSLFASFADTQVALSQLHAR